MISCLFWPDEHCTYFKLHFTLYKKGNEAPSDFLWGGNIIIFYIFYLTLTVLWIRIRSDPHIWTRISIGIQSMSMRIWPIDINSNQVYFLLCHENINMLSDILKGTVSRDFLLLVFLMNQLPPSPRVLGPFRIFSKICGDNRNSMCTTGINDTGGKFATGVNVATGVNDTGGK